MEQTRHSALTHHRLLAHSFAARPVRLAMLGLWIGALGATEARSQELVSRSSIARVTVQGKQASVQSDRRKSDWLWHVQVEQVDRRRFDELAGSPVFRRLQCPFGRGINLGNALDAPREGAWGFRLEAWHFEAIAKAGFDFVRIPIRWSAHTKTSPPYTIDPRFAERVDWAIEQATKHDLAALINVHHFDEIMEQPQQERARFLAIWKQLAERYRHAPDSVSFELLNEPHGKMSAEFWNGLLSETITLIRRSHPGRTIVVGPVRYNNIQALESLRVPRDPHIVVTVHYYNPFRFTHQGASWVGGDARSWLGTRCVAEESWKRKMGYAYWAFDAGFDAYDRQRGKWHGPIVDALVPGGRRR